MGDALQPERHLVAHPLGDQLVGVLEHQAGMGRQLTRPVVARVQAFDQHAAGQLAAVEVRHEAERGPQQRRLAQPDSPTISTSSPGSTSSVTPSRAGCDVPG